MKQLRGICNQLMAILIATFILGCQSNSNNVPAPVKKYSEYTDLEKMNLKGDVIGLKDYEGGFYFFNERGMIDKTFFSGENSHYSFSLDVFNNDILTNRFYFFEDFNVNVEFKYDMNSFLVEEISSGTNNSSKKIYKNDKNGFPIEVSDETYKDVKYWNNGTLDSSKTIFFDEKFGGLYNKFLDGRCIIFKNSQGIENFKYTLDSKGNDIKKITINDQGIITDSSERIIIYKGEDLSKYIRDYVNVVSKLTKTDGTFSFNKNIDNNTTDNYQEQPQQKEKIMCSRCGGTGQKICDNCYGKGETRCYRCNGTGFASDGRRCIYCNGGFEKCTRCYGKTRLSCDGCASRGYTNY